MDVAGDDGAEFPISDGKTAGGTSLELHTKIKDHQKLAGLSVGTGENMDYIPGRNRYTKIRYRIKKVNRKRFYAKLNCPRFHLDFLGKILFIFFTRLGAEYLISRIYNKWDKMSF